jgi:uncharacterized protein (TIGR03545 family)
MKDLPTKDALKEYENRVRQVTEGKVASVADLQKRRDELKQVKEDLSKDKAAINAARDTLADARQTLSGQFKALKNAPREDLQRIMERYGLDSAGASNLTRLLFGDEAQRWFDLVQTWYSRIQRFLPKGKDTPEAVKPPRGEGRFIQFRTDEPLPGFLIRRANLTADVALGKIGIQLADVTHQPHILGRPMRLTSSADSLQGARSFRANGVFDHVNPAAPIDQMEWTLAGWELSDVTLSKSDNLPVKMSQAMVDVTGNIKLASGTLDGVVDGAFKSAQWQGGATEGFAARVTRALSGIDQFNVTGKMSGDPLTPKLRLSSDLDDQIKDAATEQLRARQAELEQQLKNRLNTRVEDAAGPYQEQLATLTRTEGSLKERLDKLEELLKAEVQSAVDAEKEKAREKVEDKLKDKLKDLKF